MPAFCASAGGGFGNEGRHGGSVGCSRGGNRAIDLVQTKSIVDGATAVSSVGCVVLADWLARTFDLRACRVFNLDQGRDSYVAERCTRH